MSINVFHAKPSLIKNFMVVKGYGGSVYDASFGYFQSLSGISDGTLYDHINGTLLARGYSGSIEDMLGAFFITETGISDRDDAERAFWNDTTNGFDGGGGGAGPNDIVDESGGTITDESGNTITWQ
jgi:hypothetical protein